MAQTSKWNIDPHHSEVQFKVKHLMLANLSGTFKTFNGEVESENEDFTNAVVNFKLDASSVDTYHEVRDVHLRSADFLDAEQFPEILFNGSLQKQNGKYALQGQLTLRGVKKNLTMDVDYNGIGKGRHGDIRAGFEASVKINRKDFGISFGLLTETGSMVVGEEIKLHFDIELIKQ